MPQSSSPGTGVEARPARKGEAEGASQLGQEGGESAGCRAGALASRGLGLLLRPPPRPFLSPDCPVTPTPGEPGGRQSILRAALRPLGATKAGSGDGEACAEATGLRALQPHVEPSAARPPLQSSRARVSLGAGHPGFWARGFKSTRMRPDLSPRVRGLPLHGAPHKTVRGDPNKPRTPVREHAPAHWVNTYTQTRTQPARPALPALTRRGGLLRFGNAFISPFRSRLPSGFGLSGLHLDVRESVGENGNLDKVSAERH